MKKVLAIALVLCLVVGAVFASKGDMRVGGQLGYTKMFSNQKEGPDSKNYWQVKGSLGGFSFAVDALYNVADEISVKAALGLVIPGGKPYGAFYTCVDGDKTEVSKGEFDYETPVQFSAYIGGQYAFAITKEFKIAAGAGLDVILGKDSKDDDAKLVMMLGARYSVFFVSTDEDLKETRKSCKDLGLYFFHLDTGLNIFAGCTYKI